MEFLLLIILLYFSISLLHYGWRNQRFRRKNTSDFNGGTVFIILLLAPVFSLVRVISTIVGEFMTYYEPGHDQFCARLYKVSAVLFYLGIAPVFYVLWMRQRVLYDHPIMSSNYRSTIKWFSLLSIYALTGSGLFGLVLFLFFPSHMESDYDGCHQHFEVGEATRWPNLVVAFVMTINKALLLVLYILPMRKHNQMKKCLGSQLSLNTVGSEGQALDDNGRKISAISAPIHSRTASSASRIQMTNLAPRTLSAVSHKSSVASSVIGMSRRTERKMGLKVKSILRQCIVISCVSIAIDIVATIYNSVLPLEFPRIILLFSFDVVLVLNVFCVSLLFRDFKKMWTSLFIVYCRQDEEGISCEGRHTQGVLKSSHKDR